MSASQIQRQLNNLARAGTMCRIAQVSGTASLFHYKPLLAVILGEEGEDETKKWLQEDGCYVFEVGLNYGHVFAAQMVRSIEYTESEAIIHLKGS